MTKRKRRSQGRTGIQRPRRGGAGRVGGLMERLATIAGDHGIDTTKKLTREQAHDRKLLRKAGKPSKRARPPSRFAALRGTRKSGMTTDELMNLLRGYDEDSCDPGFKNLPH